MVYGGMIEKRAESFGDIGTGGSFTAAFGQTWDDNISTKLYDKGKLWSLEDEGEKLPRDVVQQRLKEEKVELKDIPEEGVTQAYLDYHIERQQDKRKREAILQESTSNMGVTGSAALLAGILDPVGLAVDAVVSKGLGKVTQIGRVIKQSRGLNRLAIRSAVGAGEGIVSMGALEPGNYALSQSLGDNYTIEDSFQNIAFGAAFGGILHAGGGAISDLSRASRFKKLKAIRGLRDEITARKDIQNNISSERLGNKPNSSINIEPSFKNADPILLQMADTTPEFRDSYFKTALSQLLDDQEVDVSLIRELEVSNAKTEIDMIDVELEKAREFGYQQAVDSLEARKEKLIELQNGVEIDDAPTIETIKLSNKKRKNKKIIQESVDSIDSHIKEGNRVELVDKEGAKIELRELSEGKAIDVDGNEVDLRRALRDGYEVDVSENVVNGPEIDSPRSRDEIFTEAKNKAANPSSRYIDEDLLNEIQKGIDDIPEFDRFDTVNNVAEVELENLRSEASYMDPEITASLDKELEAIDLEYKKAEEQSDALVNMASCIGVRGAS